MNKLLDFVKSTGQKWRELSKGKRTAFILGTAVIIALIVVIFAYTSRVTYAPLFYNMEPQDAAKIREKLISEKISYKVQGDTILVPKEKVEELRISVYSDGYLPSSGKGFELFDESKFGVTDMEANVMYQRALETELARTIQGLDEIDKVRVHLVLPEESVFTRDTEKARASVTLKMRGTTILDPEQVKSIIALISGSVKNLPKENIEVIDDKLNHLSEGLFDGVTDSGTMSASKQQELEKGFETKLQKDVSNMLEAVFGNGKVTVNVNTDMDFDSRKISQVTYDKEKIERSQKIIKETTSDTAGNSVGSSPVDNNMQNSAGGSNNQNSETSREETTVNYEIPQKEEVTVKAPGEVKRMTVSVIIDGDLSDEEKSSIKDIVAAATGYSEQRGDLINIAAYHFNSELKDKAKADLEEMQKKEAEANKIRTYVYAGAGAAGVILLIILISAVFRRRKKSEEGIVEVQKPGIDVVIGDTVSPGAVITKQGVEYQPVLSDDEIDMNLEKELQTYASKKPDQVIEVIKSWLIDDER